MKTKTFDCVAVVRKIRDANYERYKDLSLKEFTEKLSEEARTSELWRKFVAPKTGTITERQ
ncbi:MAG: hypothetical protein A2W19_06015 [Spirochaetes bacterium RBG_16_49_21]|nr:MAG: hypothetical protein A2W19_06015 [Spirochaetes bacterium RBG_16_49_21]